MEVMDMCEEHVNEKYDRVMVFSATKARDRGALGERVTGWLRGYTGVVADKIVKQSSDHTFHCISITLFCVDKKEPRRTRRKKNGG